jgi:DNA-binding response OmpR family regulator
MVKLLMVDDRTVAADLARAGYRKMGVQVACVHDIKSCFDQLVEKHYDLLVINLDYTKIDPVRLLKTVKSSKEFSDLPVVVTSVQSSAKIKAKALELGALLFIEQPVPVTFFIEKVKGLLDKQVRTNTRVEVYGKATVLASGHSTDVGIIDISNTGVLISGTNLEAGAQALVTLELDGLNKPIKINGEVIRSRSGTNSEGTALKFSEFIGDGEERLSKFIDKHKIHSSQLKYYF